MDTEIPNIATHLSVAQSLYIQRVNNAQQDYTKASVQMSIERRLLVHLYVLSNEIDEDESQPKDDAELFVYIARRLLSPNKSNLEQVLIFTKEFFIEYPDSDGIINAFTLFFNNDINILLKNLFESTKSLRAVIISIWHVCGQQIPLGLLNQSELQHFDSELQSAVLQYHADKDNAGLDLFKKYYRSLLDNKKIEKMSAGVVLASLWGGLLRKDKSINTAIRRAIEIEKDEKQREKYLRLAAISGDIEFLPIFTSVAENKPEFGSYLISLLGTQESVKALYLMLQDPKISTLVIPAWKIITGHELKVIPRISLAKNNSQMSTSVEVNDNVPVIADVVSAKQWAKQHASRWEKDTRYFHGEICNKSNLIKLSYLLSGKIAKDVFELLAVTIEGKINLNLNNWVSERYLKLDEIS